MSTFGNNNWGASTGFARRASLSGPPGSANASSGGLFGNTSTGFGQGTSTTPARNTSTSEGIFGNKRPATGGAFGNSTTPAAPAPANTGGLFGNSGTTAAAPAAQTNTGGLFGNTTTAPSAATTTGGLFGNTSTTQPTQSSTLFGNTSKPANSIFGNSTNQTSQQSTGGLFGQQQSQSTGGLFSGQQPQPSLLTVQNSNPYSYGQLLTNLQTSNDTMPESITTQIFSPANQQAKDMPERKRRFSYLEKPEAHKPKSSLLAKLGQTFRFIRGVTKSSQDNGVKGLFSQNDELLKKPSLPIHTPAISTKNAVKSYRQVDARRVGSMKRLIIKSKPVKYHLIDVNKVFNSKRRKVDYNVITADKLLSERYLSDSESDEEIDTRKSVDSRYAYNINKDGSIGGNVIEGDHKVSSKSKQDTTATEKETTSEAKDKDITMHDGYWSSPTILELSQMTLEELSSLENFIIGRKGYGQISYIKPVDLSSILLDANDHGQSLAKELFGNVIQITKRHILVYSNQPVKPPIGKGLNVPAMITLEGVVPTKGRSLVEHVNFLKGQVGQEFITYDPITHSWVFRVNHFSVWGLVEEEDGAELMELKRKQDEQEQQSYLEYSKVYGDEIIKQEVQKKALYDQVKIIPGGWEYEYTSTPDPLNLKRELVSNEIIEQLNKYKQSDHHMEYEQDSNSQYESQMLAPEIDMNEIVDEKVYEPEIVDDAVFDNIQIRSNLPTSDDWLIQLELANDLNSALAPYYGTVQPTKKLTIDNVDGLLFHEFNNSIKEAPKLETILDEIEVDDDEQEDVYVNNISEVISTILNKSEIVIRENTYPKVESTSNLTVKDFITREMSESEHQVITLASALYDNDEVNREIDQLPSRANESLVNAITETTRRKLFGEWLKNYNASAIRDLLETHKSEPLETVFIHLCSGDLIKAIEAAIETKNGHLSVILNLADSNDEVVKQIAAHQLKQWAENEMNISQALVKIYSILSGEIDSIVADLPWNIALALHLFYGGSSLGELVSSFKDIIPEDLPVGDVLRLVFILPSSVESIANSCLNKKLKWYFCKALLCGDSLFDEVTKSFGDYLVSVKLWKDAIFVYSHLSDDEEAEALVRELIIENISSLKSEQDYLMTVLKVPKTIIYEAISIEKRNNGDFWGEVEALETVELWEMAHSTIVSELGPATVISNSDEDVRHLQSLITPFPSHGLIIPDWNVGAGIYVAYFKFLEQKQTGSVDSDVVEFLLSNIPLIKHSGESFDRKVALNIISKTVGDYILESKFVTKKDEVVKLYLDSPDLEYFKIRLAARV
ncbi:Nucleoporin [Spathaspora sp. JA1]|nr:Nucleoporin [Spathaspora sp. JA1]